MVPMLIWWRRVTGPGSTPALPSPKRSWSRFCSSKVFAAAAEEVRMWQLYAERDINNPDPDKAAREADKNTPVGIDVVPGSCVHRRQPRRPVAVRSSRTNWTGCTSCSGCRIFVTVSNAPRNNGVPRRWSRWRHGRRQCPPVANAPNRCSSSRRASDHFAWLCHTAAGTIIEPELAMPYLSQAEIERMVFDPPNRKLEASYRTSSPAPYARSSDCVTGTANTPRAATNPPPSATSTTSNPAPATASRACATVNCCASTTTGS